MNIFEELKEIITKRLGIDVDIIKRESSFINDLGADSLEQVDLVMDYEDKFDIRITADEASTVETVNDAISLIKNHRIKKKIA